MGAHGRCTRGQCENGWGHTYRELVQERGHAPARHGSLACWGGGGCLRPGGWRGLEEASCWSLPLRMCVCVGGRVGGLGAGGQKISTCSRRGECGRLECATKGRRGGARRLSSWGPPAPLSSHVGVAVHAGKTGGASGRVGQHHGPGATQHHGPRWGGGGGWSISTQGRPRRTQPSVPRKTIDAKEGIVRPTPAGVGSPGATRRPTGAHTNNSEEACGKKRLGGEPSFAPRPASRRLYPPPTAQSDSASGAQAYQKRAEGHPGHTRRAFFVLHVGHALPQRPTWLGPFRFNRKRGRWPIFEQTLSHRNNATK